MRISLSTTIYPIKCLERSAAAFADFCSVSVAHEQKRRYSIEILPHSSTADVELLSNEFLNYLLAVSIENHLINGSN